MTIIVFILYNLLFVPLLYCSVKIAGLFNAKFRMGLKGRRKWLFHLKSHLDNQSGRHPRLWMHCSSAGEYEQGMPIISAFQKRYPNSLVVVSFFSPSGYEHVSVPSGVIKTYLPMDSRRNARRFIDAVNPTISVIIRHDIWPNYQFRLKQRGIPSILVDASISDEKRKVYRSFRFLVKLLYATFHDILTISEEQGRRLLPLYPSSDHLHVTGDTRYDQVDMRAHDLEKIKEVVASRYFTADKTLVVGSSWPSDEKYLLPALFRIFAEFHDFKAIVVPHELTPKHLEEIEIVMVQNGIAVCRYSLLEHTGRWDFRVLLVDCFGLLANLYALGQMAYVGGGFGLGVNSVLEPAAHGCGVIFGPRFLNVAEAKQLLEIGGAKAIRNGNEIYAEIKRYLTEPEVNARRGKCARQMVHENLGASQAALDIVDKLIT